MNLNGSRFNPNDQREHLPKITMKEIQDFVQRNSDRKRNSPTKRESEIEPHLTTPSTEDKKANQGYNGENYKPNSEAHLYNHTHVGFIMHNITSQKIWGEYSRPIEFSGEKS